MRGDGPPLVLVHGTSADHTRWNAVIGPLSERFTTYAVDRRGRGASSDAEPYTIEAEFDDIATVVDGIGGEVDLLGHSYGAACSLEAALRTRTCAAWSLRAATPGRDPDLSAGLHRAPGDAPGRRRSRRCRTTFLSTVVQMPPAELAAMRRDPSWTGRVAARTPSPESCGSPTSTRRTRAFRGAERPTLLSSAATVPRSGGAVGPAAARDRGSQLTAMAGQRSR